MIEGYINCGEGFMKYAVEIGSGILIYLPSSVGTGSNMVVSKASLYS
jgi:hypothetical protein